MQEKHEKKEEIGMRIAVCDDEKYILEEVRSFIKSIQKDKDIEIAMYFFQDASDLKLEIENEEQYDLVLLDIEIGDVNGIELAKKIKSKQPTTMIAFITGYSKYVWEVFDVQPCGFIRKPLKRENVEEVIYKAINVCDNMPTFSYGIRGKLRKVYLKDIYYITSEKRTIIMHTVQGECKFYGKMDEVESELKKRSNHFIRISQSTLINFKYLREIDYYTVVIEMNQIPQSFSISQRYRELAREQYIEIDKIR